MPTKPKAKPSKKAAQTTVVTLLLDKSYSMLSIKGKTLEGYNQYVESIKDTPEPNSFTLVQFDTVAIEKTAVDVPIAQAPRLDDQSYVPRGNTPLYEAVVKTIAATKGLVATKTDPRVLFVIQTDGEENSSGPEYTLKVAKAAIEEVKALGWEVVFLGADLKQTGYAMAGAMGIGRGQTMSYSGAQSESAFAAVGAMTRGVAGGMRGMAFSAAQKSAAGDVYDGDTEPQRPHPVTLKPSVQPFSATPPVVAVQPPLVPGGPPVVRGRKPTEALPADFSLV